MNKSSAYPVGLFAFNALVLVLWNNMNSSVILLNLLRIALGNSAEWKGGRKRGLEEGDWAGTEARGAGYCL